MVDKRGSIEERTCFNLVRVGATGSGEEDIDLQGLGYLRRIADEGVGILDIPFLDMECESKCATTSMLQALFPAPAYPHRPLVGVYEISLSDTLPVSMIAPMLTAVQSCQTLHTVVVEMEDPERSDRFERARRKQLWRWIAYALFSRDARHNIQEVVIDARNLRAADVSQIRKTLAMENPLELLVGKKLCRHHDYIRASRFEFVAQRNESDLDSRTVRHELVTPDLMVVRVIQCPSETNSQWWSVILPGRGPARVHEDEVSMTDSETAAVGAYPAIPHIEFSDMHNSSKDHCLALLEALPCTVEGVEFSYDEDEDDEVDVTDWYPAVLTACPGLKRFILPQCSTIRGLEPFIDHAADGTCVLEVVAIDSYVGVQNNSLLKFIQALADVTHPLARHLRELQLTIYMDMGEAEESVDVTEFLEAVQTMLDRNRRLHTISLRFAEIDDISELKWRNAQAAIAVAPLARHSKLAFLSVVARDNETRRLGAGLLDTSVITLIFQFAAEHRTRQLFTTIE